MASTRLTDVSVTTLAPLPRTRLTRMSVTGQAATRTRITHLSVTATEVAVVPRSRIAHLSVTADGIAGASSGVFYLADDGTYQPFTLLTMDDYPWD